nr:hypothetical protein CFP56_74923 [Quercus suber]
MSSRSLRLANCFSRGDRSSMTWYLLWLESRSLDFHPSSAVLEEMLSVLFEREEEVSEGILVGWEIGMTDELAEWVAARYMAEVEELAARRHETVEVR